ncbi:ABC transporter permease [Niastella yeongjuensis]|uniref:ABC transporter permease n=1 Tax=Niastella yeongjuensis TaxID=354355 RepID=A0A1V9F8N3_9BACT|nr:ABC transporter permease [Niastella yeongjuensis]OQP54685.1 ABC transporter permease [Niastella yeongjuensis]SEN97990.1 ABC-type antimicrobial peptide transport system, permease component [Niastella yeongjuensis]
MFKNYLVVAWRNLVKGRMHSAINILGLCIGMSVALLIGLWLHDELSFDKNFKHYDRIATVIQNLTNNGETQTWNNVPYPLANELRTSYGSDFKHIVMSVNINQHLLTIGDKKIKQRGGFFEKEMPEMFSLNMLKGSRSALNDPNAVLISASAAKAFFGNEDPLNKIIKIDQKPVVSVAGVYEDFPQNSTFADLNFISSWDFWYNANNKLKDMEDPWRPNFTTLYVQLNEQASVEAVNARIRDAKMKKLNPELQKKKPVLFLMPMSKWHLYSEFKNGVNTGGAIQYVWLFGIIGGFVLLLACINFMNLSTAQSEKRAKEVGVRKTMGSPRKQLMFQFFCESLITVAIALLISLTIVLLTLPFFNTITEKQIKIPWFNVYFWAVCLVFLFITAIIAGSYPALYLSSFKPVKVLKGTFRTGRFATIPRKALVVVQFSISVTLIIATIAVYKQIQFAKNRPVGYTRSNLINIPTTGSGIHDHFNAVKEELLQTGVVESVVESASPTTGINNTTSGFSWPGKDPNLSIDFGVITASFEYGKTVGWNIKAGRDFSKEFLTDTSGVILNEAAVRFMNLKDPIGKQVTWWGQPLRVIGVVENMVIESPYSEVKPIIYTYLNYPGDMNIVKLNPAVSAKDALSKLEPLYKKLNPDQPFEYSFIDADYAKKFNDEERIGKLAGIFAGLAILISCLGLFGLTSFVAEQRKKEVGVRKVLGATVFTLWNLLSKEFLVLVVISFLVSLPVSWYFTHNWLQNFSYRTTLSWWVFVAAGTGALLITLVTVSFQTIKAAIANPVKSLRTE